MGRVPASHVPPPIGRPESRTRATSLRFEHREHTLPSLAGRKPLAVAALGASSWLAVDPEGALLRLDLNEDTPERLGSVGDTSIDLTVPLALHVSACARFAAVVNQRGSLGVVVDLSTGAVTMRLDRGSYRTENCDFSVAFFRDGERTLLVHATDWNRLDLSDPATGARLSAREQPPRGEPSQPIPTHDLNYFHGGLTVSPDNRGNGAPEVGPEHTGRPTGAPSPSAAHQRRLACPAFFPGGAGAAVLTRSESETA